MQETSNHPNDPSSLQPELQQPSCRYFRPGGSCTLKRALCEGKSCRDQRPADAAAPQKPSWEMRLCALPPEKQDAIAKKYYGGKYPWRDMTHGK